MRKLFTVCTQVRCCRHPWLWCGQRSAHCCACAKFTSTASSDNADTHIVVCLTTPVNNDNLLPARNIYPWYFMQPHLQQQQVYFLRRLLINLPLGSLAISTKKVLRTKRDLSVRKILLWIDLCVIDSWAAGDSGDEGSQQQRARPEDGWGGPSCSRRGEVLHDSALCLLLTHCINSADVPIPKILWQKYQEKGRGQHVVELHCKEAELYKSRRVVSEEL